MILQNTQRLLACLLRSGQADLAYPVGVPDQPKDNQQGGHPKGGCQMLAPRFLKSLSIGREERISKAIMNQLVPGAASDLLSSDQVLGEEQVNNLVR